MSFSILTVRDAISDDARLYPTLGRSDDLIDMEPLDGTDTVHLTATALHVYEVVGDKRNRLNYVTNIKADVFITDARLAIACSKYDKGSTWYGGSPLIIPLNIATKTAAAIRRHGKLLVGQVRYGWLAQVGHASKHDWKSSEQVRLVLKDGTDENKRRLLFDLTLPKNVDAAEVSACIARRAAAYRLRYTALDNDQEFRGFETLTHAQALPQQGTSLAMHTMPTFYNATFSTAYPTTPSREG